MTRTQKVGQPYAERYASLIEGLYGAAGEASIWAEITYEDGRKGKLEATVRIVDLPPIAGHKGRRSVRAETNGPMCLPWAPSR